MGGSKKNEFEQKKKEKEIEIQRHTTNREKRHSQIAAAWVCSAQDNEPEKATGDVWSETRRKEQDEEGDKMAL